MENELFSKIRKAVKKAVGTECDVFFKNVEKNNGVMLQAVIIMEHGGMVSPQIYIDEILAALEAGEICFQDAIDEIVAVYKSRGNIGNLRNIVSGLSKEKILENVICQVVNRERNGKMLIAAPYKEVLDLAAVYRVIVSENESYTASFLASHEICRKYGVSPEELDAAAMWNTKEKGFEIRSMVSILAEISGTPEEVFAGNEPSMYVLTNERKIGGASVMLYPEEFEKAALPLKDDLYVLPSSIHEVIAVPATGINPDELVEMVSKINATEVSSEEFLSNNIYRYSRSDGCLRMI